MENEGCFKHFGPFYLCRPIAVLLEFLAMQTKYNSGGAFLIPHCLVRLSAQCRFEEQGMVDIASIRASLAPVCCCHGNMI
ncbi:hypothetical protein U1Q18_029396 [Sarracenia purpurea var. burkii]